MTFEWRTTARRDNAFKELLLSFWIRPATWLHSVHEITVPTFQSPQCSWWVYWLKRVQHSGWLWIPFRPLGRCGSLIVYVWQSQMMISFRYSWVYTCMSPALNTIQHCGQRDAVKVYTERNASNIQFPSDTATCRLNTDCFNFYCCVFWHGEWDDFLLFL